MTIHHYDMRGASVVPMTMEIDFAIETMTQQNILDIEIVCEIEVIASYAKYIDLMELVPYKFRSSEVLIQLLDEYSLQTGTWVGYINDLVLMIDKYKVSDNYMQYLADLIGLQLVTHATTAVDDKRNQLVEALDWYKMKGTYQALIHIGYILGMNLNLWDMYTNDYVTFIREPWFVGRPNENPGGLDSSYYKSAHLGVEVFLNKVYGSASSAYLFKTEMFNDLYSYVEKVRPVNVVPHYSVLLEPVTNETGATITVDGNISTAVLGTWDMTKVYFDDDQTSSGGGHKFDNGLMFDNSATAFLTGINKWKLGTGNKGQVPHTSGFALEHEVLSGDVSDFRIYADHAEFEIDLPTTVIQSGLSELGLYLEDGTIEIGATFPDVELTTGMYLRIVVKVYF